MRDARTQDRHDSQCRMTLCQSNNSVHNALYLYWTEDLRADLFWLTNFHSRFNKSS